MPTYDIQAQDPKSNELIGIMPPVAYSRLPMAEEALKNWLARSEWDRDVVRGVIRNPKAGRDVAYYYHRMPTTDMVLVYPESMQTQLSTKEFSALRQTVRFYVDAMKRRKEDNLMRNKWAANGRIEMRISRVDDLYVADLYFSPKH